MKKKILFLASIIICLLSVVCINSTTCSAAKAVKVSEIKVTNIDYSNYYSMRVSGTLQIKTSISPKNATNKNITWSSSDNTIAKVSKNGFVTGVNRGFCKITGVTKDGSNKKVSFYVRVYSEKEFLYRYSWRHDYGEYDCTLRLSSTGEYTMYDASAGNELESGLYTIDLVKKTLTLNKNKFTGNTTKVWNYTIVSRSKLILSDGTTQITYTRNYKNNNISCTSTALLHVPNGPKEAFVIGYEGMETSITIPSTINNRAVTSAGGLSGNTEIEQVILPDSVIGVGSFANCTNLKTITIPDGVRSLDSFAFLNCTSLEAVQLPANLVSVFQGSFQGCTSLKSIEIPEHVVNVDREAFWNCTNLESIFFPKGIEAIDSDILKGCKQVIIHGYKDTCAEEFAKDNNLTFIER